MTYTYMTYKYIFLNEYQTVIPDDREILGERRIAMGRPRGRIKYRSELPCKSGNQDHMI